MPLTAEDARTVYRGEFAYVFQVLGRLGVRGHEREDLAQEVFLRAFHNFEAYDRSRPLRPWLFGIAFRVASDFQKLRRHTAETKNDEAEMAEVGDPETNLEERRKRQLVWKALERLRLDQRALIVMHDIDEVTMPEIAAALEVPLATGYSRLRLARAAFKEAVQAAGQEARA